jgi:hypothetical protein
MTWRIDFSEFDPTLLRSWIELINFVPRHYYLFIPDAILCAYLVRVSAKIREPLISFVLGLSLCTFSDNYAALLSSHRLATFELYLLGPIFAAAWLLLNFTPFDLIFKILRRLSLLLALAAGFIAARDLTNGIDLAMNWYPTLSFPVLCTGVAFAAGKYVILHVYSAIYDHKSRSAGPIIFSVTLGVLTYYYFTDLGHISNTFWFDKEEVRLAIVAFMIVLFAIHWMVKDEIYTTVFTKAGTVLGVFVPYYGVTWTPLSRRPAKPATAPPNKAAAGPPIAGKVKTD